MAKSEQDKYIDEFVAQRNAQIGRIVHPNLGPWPGQDDCQYGAWAREHITTDVIRIYCDACGERNPLFRDEVYAKKTRWGGIIAPPGITDAIGDPYIGWEQSDHPLRLKINASAYYPNGSKRTLLRPIRPGDRIHIYDEFMGMKEGIFDPVNRPAPCREFDEVIKRTFVNQREEVAAIYERHMIMHFNLDSKLSAYGNRQRRKLTDKEQQDIFDGYENEKRRGAEVCWWDDVKVGEKIKLHTVGPYVEWCSAAACAVLCSHATAYDIAYDRYNQIELGRRWGRGPLGATTPKDPRFNAYNYGGAIHFVDWPGQTALGFYSQCEWLLGRLLTNWIGDDGWVKVIDDRAPVYPIIGDCFKCSGEVTGKRVEGDEHLVDLDVRCDNLDDVTIVGGTATVVLQKRPEKGAF